MRNILFGALFLLSIAHSAFATDDDSKAIKTMADMRTIATAWEAFATDYNSYLEPEKPTFDVRPKVEAPTQWSQLTPVPYSFLSAQLAPVYIRQLPERDGWKTPFQLAVVTDPYGNAEQYFIRSLGADGREDGRPLKNGGSDDPNDDIVFSLGQFISWNNRAQERISQAEHFDSLSGADRVDAAISLSGIAFKKAEDSSQWSGEWRGRRITIGADSEAITLATIVPSPGTLNAAQLRRLLLMQSPASPAWDYTKIVLLSDGNVAVRIHGPVNDVNAEAMPTVLTFLASTADDVARAIAEER